MACGSGASASQAQMFASLCVSGFERDRPELGGGGPDVRQRVSGLAFGGQPTCRTIMLARQVRALGQASDVLLLISVSGQETAWWRRWMQRMSAT